MAPEIVGIILIIVLFILLIGGVYIPVALSVVGIAGVIILTSPEAGLSTINLVAFDKMASYHFITLPLFVLMGEFAFHSGITTQLFNSAYKWFGHLPAGMCMGVVAASAGFGAVSGSTLVAAASMTRVSWQELMKFKYDKGLCSGILSASGGLAVLIPPSILGVVYGLFTETPIAPILMAGIIPGIITAFLLMTQLYIRARIKPSIAPRAARSSWAERIASLRSIWGALVLALIVTGGLYGGLFTASEAAAFGAFGAFLLALFLKGLTWSTFWGTLSTTARTTAFIFFILIGAYLFSRFLALSNLSTLAAEFVGGLDVPRVVILLGILLMYTVLGMILEGVSMLAVTISTVFPIIIGLGYHPVWFSTLILVMVETAAITPPVGLNVFAVKAILGEEVETWTIFKNALPFIGVHAIVITLIIAFPQINMWLPSTMIMK
jgi:tripartite ATP-independent transporter DctM subunit